MVHRQALAQGAVVGGDYEIERVLGSGGFGITYLARDKSLGIQVAIKEYFPSSLAYRDAGATVNASTDSNLDSYNWGLERFLAEARTLARLRHPNIVRVSRYFKENGTAYMVLGFVVGQDLEAWLTARGRRPSQKELDAIVGPLIDALEIVHKADVVHRDIKPANIYIQKSDRAPVLLDFGAARQALGEQTRATAAFVSPGYSPPESHENDPAAQGPWTDIYGLAATLYRAVVGKAPAQVINRLSRDTYVPLAQQIDKPGDYRPGFLAAIDKGMMLRREDRPQSVTAWRALLFGDLSEQETEVRRPDETVVVTKASSSQADTVVREPPSTAWSPNARRAIAAALALVGLAALYYIYASFEQPADNRAGGGTTEIASPNPPAGNEAADTPPASTPDVTFAAYKNARFGYELAYPTGILVPDAPPQNGGGQSFTSPDGTFQVNSFASFNSDGATAESLRRQLQADNPLYRNARVTASGDDGFSLLANDANRVNGYVAIFTCGNQLLNVLEVSFPASGPSFATYRALANRITQSFRTGQGADSPTDCSSSNATPPAAENVAQPNFDVPQPSGLFADPSLRRLAVYGWSAGGIQNGFWAAGINSNSGVLLNVKCNDGPGNQRSGIIELQNVPTGANALSGDHQVDVQIGSYVDGAPFTFTPVEGGSNAELQIAESNENAGEYLEFLRQLTAGQTMTLRIADANYQDNFNLFAADRALGPCLGQSIAQPWVDQGERDGVIGTGVRNASGGAFYIRCDTTAPTRGNVILAFSARQRPGTPTRQLETIKAFIETQFIDLEFSVVQEPDVLTGVIYHVAADSGTSNIASFLELLSRGNQLRLLNPDLGVDETFTLTGSRQTLEGCASLY
jgi:serine/threonine protein kinase